jgi:hypothetical protein
VNLTNKAITCLRITCVVVATCVISSCSDSTEITTYSIPKERPAKKTMATASTAGTGDTLRWTPPQSWKSGKESSMRLGSYMVADANGTATLDLSVTAFPGDVGGLLANVNRWLKQINLEPTDQSGLGQYVDERTVAGLPAHLMHAANAGRTIRVLTLWGGNVHRKTWFFKLEGDTALAEAESANFEQFIESVRFSADYGNPANQ